MEELGSHLLTTRVRNYCMSRNVKLQVQVVDSALVASRGVAMPYQRVLQTTGLASAKYCEVIR